VPSTRTIPVRAVVWPFQNIGQVPARLFDGDQVDRYIDRTASAAAGGRIGVKDEPPTVSVSCANASRVDGGSNVASIPARPAAPLHCSSDRRLISRFGLLSAGTDGTWVIGASAIGRRASLVTRYDSNVSCDTLGAIDAVRTMIVKS